MKKQIMNRCVACMILLMMKIAKKKKGSKKNDVDQYANTEGGMRKPPPIFLLCPLFLSLLIKGFCAAPHFSLKCLHTPFTQHKYAASAALKR